MDELTRHDVRNYPPRQDSVPAARAAWLAVAWGYPDLAGDVTLLTSELTTNALLHGSLRDRHLRVGLHLAGAVLRIEVTDPKGERRPEPRAVVADDEQYGRGLQIVNALSERWGASDRVVGKTEWAELALRPPV
ncbi:ATP-binding protein [Streptomyces sp. APSN-46.1]|uniref:ATP-binding protein n=1 Tax=Streptomyces sp. APSN-46.1 TaxID=2929049 RepID=UPI001FB1E351|nr:ATP-binding protein [Streptomyces sp. APSN-46.1]MCJ1678604.1 ATP-binding protein [Streptomyces sp. APSN-46.1]